MTATPRAVFGMPAYNRPDTLARALESLLSQTCRDFAIVIVDDKPTDEVRAIVERYVASFPCITYVANPVRLGMIGNWRRAFAIARERYPASEYFAWVSDHDVWHPRWLEMLIDALDRHPQAAFAHSQSQRVYRTHRAPITRRFHTVGMSSPLQRLRAAHGRMTAGNCIYGLFRAKVLARVGVFRPVLAPDRQIIVECLLLGDCVQVPEMLWYREVSGMFSYRRQRTMFFPTRVPLYTYLPVVVQHFGALCWDLGVRGVGRPESGRLAGIGYACADLWYGVVREVLRVTTPWWARYMPARGNDERPHIDALGDGGHDEVTPEAPDMAGRHS